MDENGRRLVGRGAELDACDATLDALGHGRTVAVVLAGEPGVGKSRLLVELGERADARGMLVLSGSASEFERDLPFWLFVDALDEYLRAVEPSRLAGLGEDTRRELGHILPSWPTAGHDPANADHRYRTHRATRQVLEALADPAPLVLLLDDLHWADSGSVELLCALLRRPPAAPVLIGMALRPRQVPERLAGALERAVDGGLVTRLELGGLSLDESRQLLGKDVDRHLAAALHTESGGNPFYLRQLARSRRPTGAGATLASFDAIVPAAVASAMLDELSLLDRVTRSVLEGAAVAGDPFELELAAAAAGLSETAVSTAVDELLARDLVRPTAAPRRFRFRHPLLRRAVHDCAPGAWRLGAHERTAEALDARGVPPPGRAHHIVASARTGDLVAVGVLRSAGAAVVHRAPVEAARWFRAAIDLLPPSAGSDALELWIALAGALGAAGQLGDARAAQLRAIDLVPDDAVALRVQLIAECAGLELTLGHHDAAHRRLVEALDRMPDPRGPQAFALRNAIALDHRYRLEHQAALDWSRRASTAARGSGDRSLLADAAVGLALSAAFNGSADEAATACADAAEQVDALSDEEIGYSPDPLAMRLAAAELFVDRHEQALRHAERSLAVARALESARHIPVLFWTGVVRTALGRLPQATALLDDGIEIARSAGNPSMLGWVLLARSAVATACADPEIALATAEESVEAHRGAVRTLPAAWAGYALAAALRTAGDPLRAIQVLQAAAGDSAQWLPHPLRLGALELLTRCHLALGRVSDAAEAAAAARTCADHSGLATARALADRAAAEIALHRDDPAHAADLALSAATAAASVGAVVDAATAHALAGRALAEAGDPDRAGEQLQRAAAEFSTCGAPRRRADIERQLRRLGHRSLHHRSRPGHRAAGGLAALTERELQIARLVTDRRTNAEIAAHLYLSTKTVETHIRNVFHKLDVTSRVEIARAVERRDRDQP